MKEKKTTEKEVKHKLGLFDLTPTQCLTCSEAFDKKNKEQVMSWYVVVREQEKKVNLYCPDCWQKAINILEGYKKSLDAKNEKR